ncbi:MAG: hypothetical protein GX428_07845 [Candidatus Atribacteria bacterium]|nr:hypothetical protein [Candidatus Atribacteria bacterium]
MKKKLKFSIVISTLLILVLSTMTSAQYSGYDWGTAYQVVNISDAETDIMVTFYNSNGEQAGDERYFQDVQPLGSELIVQKKDDTTLGPGSYSAIVSSGLPIAAIVNQQLYPPNSTNPQPPFSSYSGIDRGGRTIYLPAVMYNYYGFYTEMFIMNIGTGDATVTVDYYPTTIDGLITGASGQSSTNITIKANSSYKLSQQTMSNLGAPNQAGYDVGKFLGSAIVKSPNQDIAVVVNEHNPAQKKLLTYNGFVEGSTSVALPVHMRTFYDYYTALTILNTSDTDTACVRITYTPATDQTQLATVGGVAATPEPVVVEHTIQPLKSIMRFDGYTAKDEQSDLDDDAPVSYSQFYGSVLVESITNSTCTTAPALVAIMNVESQRTKSSQAGSYNGIALSSASNTVIAPIILADYYSYYTNLTIQNVTGNSGTCTFEYTSADGSAKPGLTKSYSHAMAANGSITIYEGRKGAVRGDVITDVFWQTSTSTAFIGAAEITCDNGIQIVGFTNEERDILYTDSMYTFNTINK